MQCQELEAIRFARRIITMPPLEPLPDGRRDPGWCCTEHAVVAALAFDLVGVSVEVCSGKVLIGDVGGGEVYNVISHNFVLVSGSSPGVFDSSVTKNGIEGIPVRYGPLYPQLAVGATENRLEMEDFAREAFCCDKSILALYGISKRDRHHKQYLRWTSTTPFGLWLTQRYGSQDGLWAKVAWHTALHLRGSVHALDYEDNQEDLWDAIANTSDKDCEFVSLGTQ